jgi:hypothetical protein
MEDGFFSIPNDWLLIFRPYQTKLDIHKLPVVFTISSPGPIFQLSAFL